jgi:flagellar motor switch protein FliM
MLSQSEIDALLSGTLEVEDHDGTGRVNLAELMGQQTGPGPKPKVGERKVQAYNFWSPDRFSKEQMRAVELVHEDLAERLTTSLPTFLRTNLRPRVVHTEQGRFHDFLKDLPQNSLFHMITLAPLPGQIVLTISPDVAYVILEQRLGGRIEREGKGRGLTEIDQSLLRGMIEHMLNDFKAAWGKVVSIEPGLEDSTVNQHWVQMMMGNERVMLITFEMTVLGIAGTMNIYIPFNLLKPVANVLNPHVWITGRKEKQIDLIARQTAMDNLQQVKLPIRIYLGVVDLSVKEITNLKVGDVLTLDTSIKQDLPVRVSDKVRFFAKVGRVGKKVAAQITSVVKPEDEFLI